MKKILDWLKTSVYLKKAVFQLYIGFNFADFGLIL